MNRLLAHGLGALSLTGAMVLAPMTPSAASAAPIAVVAPVAVAAEPTPADLQDVGNAEQVIIVTASSWRTSYGTLTAFERQPDDSWKRVFGPMTARLGFSGMTPARDRRQGTGKTPAGVFAISSAFGRQADPGTHLPYRKVDRNDAWTYNPAVPSTYNVLQTANRSWSSYGPYAEHLWRYGRQYDYVAVLDYNLPTGPIRVDAKGIRRTSAPANTDKGGGIFLHVSNGKVTAGCIAIPRAQMRAVLRWLDPEQNPVIVIGPSTMITRL